MWQHPALPIEYFFAVIQKHFIKCKMNMVNGLILFTLLIFKKSAVYILKVRKIKATPTKTWVIETIHTPTGIDFIRDNLCYPQFFSSSNHVSFSATKHPFRIIARVHCFPGLFVLSRLLYLCLIFFIKQHVTLIRLNSAHWNI